MRSGKAIVSCLLILFVVVGALQILQIHAADQTAELSYDGGNCGHTWWFTASGVGGYMAVRFTSPYPVSSVLAVKYYINSKYELDTFNVLILDSDGKPVYEKPVTPTEAGWFGIDLTGEGIVVTGEFYVAMKWTVPLAPALCADETNGHGRSIFVFADGSQATYSETNKGKDGDFMIRALVMEAKPAYLVLEQVKTAPNASEPFYVEDVGTITYVLTNGGQMQAGNVEVKVVSSAPEIEIVEVTAPKDLQPGATGEWQVKIKASKPGSYDVYVSFYIDGKKVIFEREGQTGTIEQFQSTITVSERPFLETYGLYAVVGLVAIVVVVGLVVVMRRRGRAAPPPARLAPATSVPPPTVARSPAGRFCEDCGFRMPAGSVFCPKCGARKT